MALYWPEDGVALEVVDDPESVPFTGEEDVEVIRVTSDQLEDPEELKELAQLLAELLDEDDPEDLDDEDDRRRWLASLMRKAVVS